MAADIDKLQVFISYARADASAFAEELVAGLEVAGFDPFLDRHDIAAGEDWEARLGRLIQMADTVVFVITPASVASEMCHWELARAEEMAKRIIPVVRLAVPAEQTPEHLRRRNYVFFDESQPFGNALLQLANALRTDLDWVREHSRLAELANRWLSRDRPDELLLRGSELSAAKEWAARHPAGSPEPTAAHLQFINTSEEEETKRTSAERAQLKAISEAQALREKSLASLRRVTYALVGVSVVAGIATIIGLVFIYRVNAKNEALYKLAEEQRLEAEALQERAEILEEEGMALKAEYEQAESRNAAEVERLKKDIEALTAALESSSSDDTPRQRSVSRVVREARRDMGWRFDVFFCGGANEEANERKAAEAEKLLVRLKNRPMAEQQPFLKESIRDVNRRRLSQQINAGAGYRLASDQIRGEAKEREQVEAIRNFLGTNGMGDLQMVQTKFPTPSYISIFFCEGAYVPRPRTKASRFRR